MGPGPMIAEGSWVWLEAVPLRDVCGSGNPTKLQGGLFCALHTEAVQAPVGTRLAARSRAFRRRTCAPLSTSPVVRLNGAVSRRIAKGRFRGLAASSTSSGPPWKLDRVHLFFHAGPRPDHASDASGFPSEGPRGMRTSLSLGLDGQRASRAYHSSCRPRPHC